MAAFKTAANGTRTPRIIALEKGTASTGFNNTGKDPVTPTTFQPEVALTSQPKAPVTKPFRIP